MESLYEGIVLNNPNLIEKMTGKGTITQLSNGNSQLQANVIVDGKPTRIRKQFKNMEDAQQALDNMRSRWFVSNHVERNFAKYANTKQLSTNMVNGTIEGAILEQVFANGQMSNIIAQGVLNGNVVLQGMKTSIDKNTSALNKLCKLLSNNYSSNNVVNNHSPAIIGNNVNINTPEKFDASMNEKFWKLLYGNDYLNKMATNKVLFNPKNSSNCYQGNDYYTCSQIVNCKTFYEKLCGIGVKRQYRFDYQKDRYFIPNFIRDLKLCTSKTRIYKTDLQNKYLPNEIYTFRLKCSFKKPNGLGFQKSQNKRIKNQFVDFIKNSSNLVNPNAIVEERDSLILYFVFNHDFVNKTDLTSINDVQNKLFNKYKYEFDSYKNNNKNVYGVISNVELNEPTYLPYSIETKMTTTLETSRVLVREVDSHVYELSELMQTL